jgi:hypothetical protein
MHTGIYYYKVQVAAYSCVEVIYHKQGQWNIALVEDGELCVIGIGITKMLLWCVDSWDSQPQVRMYTFIWTACAKNLRRQC